MNRRQNSWDRVTKGAPCRVCGKPDWCLISVDRSAAICARIESKKPIGSAGWIHMLYDRPSFSSPWKPRVDKSVNTAPLANATALSKSAHNAMTESQWIELSEHLGITLATLKLMRWGYSHRHACWTIPMRNGSGEIIGIRTRTDEGKKRAVRGSKSGLFFAPSKVQHECLIITEGPTDACAIMDAGFNGIVGRPSCNGGVELMVHLIRYVNPVAVLIVPDRDPPGLDGAKRLADAIANNGLLPINNIGLVIPPRIAKDCREWHQKKPDHLVKSVGAEIRKLTQKKDNVS